MINKINHQTSMPITMKQAQKTNAEENNFVQKSYINVPPKTDGMNALGNYGMSLINFANKLDVQPLLPTIYRDLNAINGEKIYSSDGKLHSIVKETPDIKTTYYVPVDNQNVIDFIESIDKKTGKPIMVQHNHISPDGKYNEMYITKLNSRTGKEEAFTCYENGKIAYAGKTVKGKMGEDVNITKYYDNGKYYISEYNERTKVNRTIQISDDKKKIDYSEERHSPKGTFETKVEFFEGLPFSVERNFRNPIPNLIGLDHLTDKDLTPAPKFDIKAFEKDLRNTVGEETRYSNGALETKKIMLDGEVIESFFNTNNELERIVTPTMEIEVHNSSPIRIKQKLGEGKYKETFFNENYRKVVYHDNGHTKALAIDTKTMNPLSYHENETVNGEERDVKSYYYNDFGMVENIYTH